MSQIIICTYDAHLLPAKHTPGAVCRDLHIAQELNIRAGEYASVSAGIKVACPLGRHGQVYARSSLCRKHGLMLANNIAIMDPDYRGEYILQFYNFSKTDKNIPSHTRLAQLTFHPYMTTSWSYGTTHIPEIHTIVDQNTYDHFDQVYPTHRSTGGIGSTGS